MRLEGQQRNTTSIFQRDRVALAESRCPLGLTLNPTVHMGLGGREAKSKVWLLHGGKDRSQVAEGPVGCGKETSLNLTSELGHSLSLR